MISYASLHDPGIARAWDELAESTAASPFLRRQWFESWAIAFDKPVEVASLSAGEALVPVTRRRGGFASPVNQESPDFGFLASDAQARARLLEGLLDGRSAELMKLGPDDAEAVVSAMGGRRVQRDVMQRSPYIDVAGRWEDYEATLRSKFVKDMRRRGRRLAEEGEVSIGWDDGASALDDLLEEGFRVELSQWKAQRGTAVASQTATRSFYERIGRWIAETGGLRLWFMRVDGKPIAFAFDLVMEGVYYGLKVAYDPAYSKFGPGLVLQHETVKYAFEAGLQRFEFLGADEPYKLNWTGTCRDRLAVRVFGRGLAGTSELLKRRYVRPLVLKLRGSERSNPGA